MARSGINTLKSDKTTEKIDSVSDTTGLAKPAVRVVEASLEVEVAVFIAAAVPPPARIAREYVRNGSKSAMVDSMIADPARPATGIAMLSRK